MESDDEQGSFLGKMNDDCTITVSDQSTCDVITAAKDAIHADDSEIYGDALLRAIAAMKEATIAKIRLFGSEGRA